MKEKEKVKTHWLQTPNKNYLGHWDLPNGKDITLTIKSAMWEEVKNPIINVSEAKRVIRFKEDVKPFICNETNAQTILRSTGCNYMEDCSGLRIRLSVSQVKMKGEFIDCLRVKDVPQSELKVGTITETQRDVLLELIPKAKKDTSEICQMMNIASLMDLPQSKYENMCKRLRELALDGNN